jgi:hypothetical protein
MTTFVYNSARTAFATGALSWPTAAVNCCLVNANYSPLPTDTNMTAIPSGARVSQGVALTALNVQNGICSGLIPVYNAFIASAPVVGVVLYVLGSSDAASQLIYYSSDGVGFPFTPAGFNYYIAFDQSSGGFFQV